MKQVRFEFEELPYETLSQFGLTQEMIEDLPMHVLEEISHGRHSPVLPIKVNDENGNTVTDRSRFVFVRKENGEADVVFYPVLKKSPLEKYSEEQQKQLRSGKVILADTVTADGRKTKAFVQIDSETNQVMSVPTQVIARNLQVLAEELKLSNAEIKVMQQGDPLTFVMEDEAVTVGISLHEKDGIRLCQGDSKKWNEQTKTVTGGSMNIQESEEFKTSKFYCKTNFDMKEKKKKKLATCHFPSSIHSNQGMNGNESFTRT